MKTLLLLLFILIISGTINAQEAGRVCTTNRNAPPISAYYWPPDTTVKVHFIRNMFTLEQRGRLFDAMTIWTATAERAGAHVRFVDAGDGDSLINCQGCLTVSRSDVHQRDRKHYAFFYPLSRDRDGLLISAWIDFDLATTSPKALQGYMAHELGHGLGLWDCTTCEKKQTIMNGFPGINRDNGLVSPSGCDLEVVRGIYQLHRQLAVTPTLKNRSVTE
ncbi:MAG TPA: hypothetical protein VMS31_21415 [Pyrinomonadaceae bacterium]|nr:hypothetical protein [Pyrinomonadaceae bacterium]